MVIAFVVVGIISGSLSGEGLSGCWVSNDDGEGLGWKMRVGQEDWAGYKMQRFVNMRIKIVMRERRMEVENRREERYGCESIFYLFFSFPFLFDKRWDGMGERGITLRELTVIIATGGKERCHDGVVFDTLITLTSLLLKLSHVAPNKRVASPSLQMYQYDSRYFRRSILVGEFYAHVG